MRRKPRPPKPDLRQPWQIKQGKACGCRGTDDMCPCQNENPWPRPRRDLEGEIRTLELQQQTDRQSIALLFGRVKELETALQPFVAHFIDKPELPDSAILSVRRFNTDRLHADDRPMFTAGDLRRARRTLSSLAETSQSRPCLPGEAGASASALDGPSPSPPAQEEGR